VKRLKRDKVVKIARLNFVGDRQKGKKSIKVVMIC